MSDVVSLPSYTKPARYHVHVLLDEGVERDVYVCSSDEVHRGAIMTQRLTHTYMYGRYRYGR